MPPDAPPSAPAAAGVSGPARRAMVVLADSDATLRFHLSALLAAQAPASVSMETLLQELQEVAQDRPAVQVDTLLIARTAQW